MTWMLDLNETMSGWISLDGGERHALELRLVASAPLWSQPTVPRPFTGTVLLGAAQESLPARGTLTLSPGGPAYDFSFTSTRVGTLRCAGRKHYSLRHLKNSLITCPLRVFRDQTGIGTGEIKYLQPMWSFALNSLRLRRIPSASAAATKHLNTPEQSG